MILQCQGLNQCSCCLICDLKLQSFKIRIHYITAKSLLDLQECGVLRIIILISYILSSTLGHTDLVSLITGLSICRNCRYADFVLYGYRKAPQSRECLNNIIFLLGINTQCVCVCILYISRIRMCFREVTQINRLNQFICSIFKDFKLQTAQILSRHITLDRLGDLEFTLILAKFIVERRSSCQFCPFRLPGSFINLRIIRDCTRNPNFYVTVPNYRYIKDCIELLIILLKSTLLFLCDPDNIFAIL